MWRKFFLSLGLIETQNFTMKVRKLHLIVVANLINFGLFLQLHDLKHHKPSGEESKRNLLKYFAQTNHQITSNDLAQVLADMRHLLQVSGSENIKINTSCCWTKPNKEFDVISTFHWILKYFEINQQSEWNWINVNGQRNIFQPKTGFVNSSTWTLTSSKRK